MSKTIQVEDRENIAVLTLDNGVTNAISPAMVQEAGTVLNELKGRADALVLTGGAKFFSMGLELPTLLKLSRQEMESFWYDFEQLILDLYSVEIPTVCAISGHAVAGGTIMALTADFRFGVSGSGKMGLNEIALGVPVPLLADLIFKQVIGERTAMHMMYGGNFISLSEAMGYGLVDKQYLIDVLVDKAVEKAASLAAYPATAFSIIKKNRTAELKRRFLQERDDQSRLFLDCWFSDEAQAILEEAAKNF